MARKRLAVRGRNQKGKGLFSTAAKVYTGFKAAKAAHSAYRYFKPARQTQINKSLDSARKHIGAPQKPSVIERIKEAPKKAAEYVKTKVQSVINKTAPKKPESNAFADRMRKSREGQQDMRREIQKSGAYKDQQVEEAKRQWKLLHEPSESANAKRQQLIQHLTSQKEEPKLLQQLRLRQERDVRNRQQQPAVQSAEQVGPPNFE